MIKLTVENSISRIEGLNVKQFAEVRKLLSYKIDGQTAYFSRSFNPTRYLIDKRGTFPTGLLYLVREYLLKGQINYVLNERRTLPNALGRNFSLSLGLLPYPEQIEASEAAGRAYRGIISAPTGFGKSVIAALIINKLKVKTLIVVPTLELKRQLTESLKTYFKRLDVGGFGCTIAVENVDGLDASVKADQYDCVIIDEFHHSAAKTYRTLNTKSWNDVFYRFGLTATPFRSDENERLLLEGVLSKVIYRLDYKTAVDKGYIVPVEAYYIDVPKSKTEGYTYAQVYNDLVVNNKARNQIIDALLDPLRHDPASTLILVKEIEHGNNILAETFGLAFMNGQDDMSRIFLQDFNTKKCRLLMGTTGILGEGVDTKPAEYIIIAGLGKSKNQFMQNVGRGLRKYPGKESCKVIIFRDTSHKFAINHFNAQKKILLDEYGVIPVKLEL